MGEDYDLRGAKRRLPWAEVARLAAHEVERSGAPVSMRSAAVAAAAAASGYSAASIVSQIRLRNWIETKAREFGVDPATYLGARFAPLEAAMQLDRHEPEKTRRLLDLVVEESVTVEAIKRDLKRLVSQKRLKDSEDRDALAAERHERRRRVKRAIESGCHGMGKGELLTTRPVWQRADGTSSEWGPVCRFTWWLATPEGPEGFDLLHLPAGTTARAIEDRIARALASSAFFRAYHLIVMEPTPFLPRIQGALDWAKLPHIGIYTATMGPPGSQTVELVQKRVAVSGPITENVRDFMRAVADS
ncbi:hypothetical protein [Bradyrhizobium sp. CCBAU 21360]|nr:hypothetical protein [Bradyrhizobium sp. CCBAU 21360]MDA9451284.1 hypothetical protein [Bradyrhizobium sp. CCBAU 21360]MDA9457664.1 hypothetical protein [Bradyrhizobium sp. CCBAU 21359]